MKTVTFTEFRRCASGLLSEVERGETVTVLRHGKPIAEVSPVGEKDKVPAWKKPGLRLAARGSSLSSAILEERASSGR